MTRRVAVYTSGFAHENPVPAACRIGQFLFSGVLTGRDAHTHEIPATLDEQVANVFDHVRELLETAGGSTDDIVKMTFWLADYRNRDALNRHWLTMFPDAATRPARQAMAATFDRGTLVQCDLVAVLSTT